MWSTVPISEQAHGSFTCHFLRKWSSLLLNFGAFPRSILAVQPVLHHVPLVLSLHAQQTCTLVTVALGWTLTVTSHSGMHVGLFQLWELQSTLTAISECTQPTFLTSAEMTQKPAPFSRQTQMSANTFSSNTFL